MSSLEILPTSAAVGAAVRGVDLRKLTDAEFEAIFEAFGEHAARPEFQTRWRWTPGAVAMWDNRSTWHLALSDDPGHRRSLHRVTVEGGPLTAAD